MKLINAEGYKTTNTESFTIKEGTIFLFLDKPTVFISFNSDSLSQILEKCLILSETKLKKLLSGQIVKENGFYYAQMATSVAIWS
jgi:hypothetical protein